MKHYSEVGYVIDRDVWLTPFEYAEHIGCSLRTMYNKKSAGELQEDFLLTDGRRWYAHKDMPSPIKQRGNANTTPRERVDGQ